MKFILGCGLALLLNGCASSPKATPATPAESPAPAVAPVAATAQPEADEAAPEPPKSSAAEAWAEQKMRAEAAAPPPSATDAAGADPLAIGEGMASASTTNVEVTPVRQLRQKTVRDLEDGRKIAEKADTFDDAVQKLKSRLGKPTWVENGKKHVWVVRDRTHCYRLVLDADGSIETETVVADEMRMVSALSQQNACTGVVVNGVPGMKR
jgi:hypothetical protein